MADTPDTPDSGSAEKAKPAPRRRAAARKPATPKASRPADKSVVAKAEDSVAKAATAAKDAVTGAADKAVKAVKPRSTKRATPRAASTPGRTKASSTRSTTTTTKRSGTTPKRSGGKKADKRSTLEKATDRVGGRWGVAAIAGGVAAAAGAALLTLRGSTPAGSPRKPIDISGSGDKGEGHPQTVHTQHAHQPDGTNSSKSFQAGIADENTVPDKA